MDIAKRFINILRTNKKEFNEKSFLSDADIDNLLKDDSNDELSKMIADASNFPLEIISAFAIMDMEHTQDISLVTLQFRNLMNKYHPDKNTYFNDNKTFNKKSSDIIEAYNLIKNYLEK